jgi:hypothetical protein
MNDSLYKEINTALKDRGEWADRQEVCYRMRNGGVRRRNKPYPNAPDGHYPLGDTMVEKLKPAYVQQLYGSETIAQFVCLLQQDQDITTAASQWFDYQLKQRSNFERTMMVAIDQMLEQAFSPVKVYWDAKCKRLAFDQVDPLHLIVPTAAQEYNENGGCDWLVHVLHLSVSEYRANDKFKQGDDFVKRIKGRGQSDAGASDTGTDKKQSVDLKEGINSSKNDNEIVLWEVYKRDRKDKKIRVETISPLLPCDGEENVVRAEFGLPYNQGVFKHGETFPFFKIRSEIKGKGHYSSRGVIEVNAPFESSLTKMWNTIHQHLDFSAQPNYESTVDGTMPTPNSVRTAPGAILPRGLKLAQHPPPPVSLRQDMEMTRAIAEDRTQIPDLGASNHLSGDRGAKGNVTAEQIRAIVGQSGQGNDLKARVFRLDLAQGLNMAWSLALQYLVPAQGAQDTGSLQYVIDNEVRTIEPAALHDSYEIQPNGSADSWNKGSLVSKRMAYYQTFQGNPFVPLDELTKWVLEADDPRNVKRLFRDPGITQKTQEEDQAMECLLMQSGWAPQVLPADDDKIHLLNLAQFAQDKIGRAQMTPELARLVLTHGQAHQQQLFQKKDPIAKQAAQQLAPLAQILGQIAQSDHPGNIVQMQQQPPAEQTASVAQPIQQPQSIQT